MIRLQNEKCSKTQGETGKNKKISEEDPGGVCYTLLRTASEIDQYPQLEGLPAQTRPLGQLGANSQNVTDQKLCNMLETV